MADPTTGQLFVVSKDIFGGTIYAAPRGSPPTTPTGSRAVADGLAFATDGSFFPDGRHYVVRGYTSADGLHLPRPRAARLFPLPAAGAGRGDRGRPRRRALPQHRGAVQRRAAGAAARRVAAAMAPTAARRPDAVR